MTLSRFLLYGANGYTGRLIATMAKDYNLEPILAGRNASAIRQLATDMHLPFRIADLNDKENLEKILKDVPAVIHAAGPFSQTAGQMIEACLATRTHYIDLNGDIEVFEMIRHYDEKAREARIMLLSGAAFNMAPTNCMALLLKNKLPDAVHLKLAMATLGGSLSHGTAMTMINRLGEKGSVRENGEIIKKPLGHKGMWVDFGTNKSFVMTIPWGDVATAYYTTGIPGIENYVHVNPWIYSLLKFQILFNWLLRKEWFRNIVRKKINSLPPGPSDEMRAKARSYIWGEAANEKGEKVQARMIGPDGYTLTAHISLIIIQKVIQGNFCRGYQTPAGCYGADLIMEVPGMKREIL